jgi:putative membrane protein
MFLWTTPLGRRTFKLSESYTEQSKALAANMGLYNGFLAAGLVWGLIMSSQGTAILLFF